MLCQNIYSHSFICILKSLKSFVKTIQTQDIESLKKSGEKRRHLKLTRRKKNLYDDRMKEICSQLYRFLFCFVFFVFFCYPGFISQTSSIQMTAAEGGGFHFLFNSTLPLLPSPQNLRPQPGDCYRELTSALSQQPYSNREYFISERKSLTTELRAFSSLSLALFDIFLIALLHQIDTVY